MITKYGCTLDECWTLAEIEEIKRPPGCTVVAVSDVHLTDKHRRAFVVKRADGTVVKSPSYEPLRRLWRRRG